MLPMYQIGADRMPPVNRSPERAVGVVLVEHVIRAVPMNQSIRVVQPVGRRQEVIARALEILSYSLQRNLLIGMPRLGTLFHSSPLPSPRGILPIHRTNTTALPFD